MALQRVGSECCRDTQRHQEAVAGSDAARGSGTARPPPLGCGVQADLPACFVCACCEVEAQLLWALLGTKVCSRS